MKIGLVFCILPFTLGLISAAPLLNPQYRSSHFYRSTLKAIGSYKPLGVIPHGNNLWTAAVSGFIDSTIGSRILNDVIDCRICGKCNAELQQDVSIKERSTSIIMALMQIMDDINAAKESLNALKKLSIKDDRNAEAQFNGAVSGKINSIRDTLVNAGEYLRGAAKNILCH